MSKSITHATENIVQSVTVQNRPQTKQYPLTPSGLYRDVFTQVPKVPETALEVISYYTGCVSSLSWQSSPTLNSDSDTSYGAALGDNSYDSVVSESIAGEMHPIEPKAMNTGHSLTCCDMIDECGQTTFLQWGDTDEAIEELLLFNRAL